MGKNKIVQKEIKILNIANVYRYITAYSHLKLGKYKYFKKSIQNILKYKLRSFDSQI
jgi:hypothetical protein